MYRLLAAALALAFVLPAAARAEPDLASYAGLGAWVSVYRLGATQPERLASSLQSRGVGTLFLETGNYRARRDLPDPSLLARYVEAAHTEGLAVVAWYLPGLAQPQHDLRRALAALRFRTPAGEGFDGFALDLPVAADEHRHAPA